MPTTSAIFDTLLGVPVSTDRRLLAADQDVGIDDAQVDPKCFGWAQALSPDREIAAADGDTPSAVPVTEIELAPYRETAQGDPGQPGSATDLMSFPH